jgi:hypothetical protein
MNSEKTSAAKQAGGSYMGDVERIPCECIGRHDDEEAQSDEEVTP